jgi:hypothetical protein
MRKTWRNRGRRALRPTLRRSRAPAGRVLRRDDKGQPFAVGLKATDPAAAARASAACVEAEGLVQRALEAAKIEAQLQALGRERDRAWAFIERTLKQLEAYRERHFKEQRKKERDRHRNLDRYRQAGQPSRPYQERPPPALPADDPVEWASEISLRHGSDWAKGVMEKEKAARQALAALVAGEAGTPFRHSGDG